MYSTSPVIIAFVLTSWCPGTWLHYDKGWNCVPGRSLPYDMSLGEQLIVKYGTQVSGKSLTSCGPSGRFEGEPTKVFMLNSTALPDTTPSTVTLLKAGAEVLVDIILNPTWYEVGVAVTFVLTLVLWYFIVPGELVIAFWVFYLFPSVCISCYLGRFWYAVVPTAEWLFRSVGLAWLTDWLMWPLLGFSTITTLWFTVAFVKKYVRPCITWYYVRRLARDERFAPTRFDIRPAERRPPQDFLEIESAFVYRPSPADKDGVVDASRQVPYKVMRILRYDSGGTPSAQDYVWRAFEITKGTPVTDVNGALIEYEKPEFAPKTIQLDAREAFSWLAPCTQGECAQYGCVDREVNPTYEPVPPNVIQLATATRTSADRPEVKPHSMLSACTNVLMGTRHQISHPDGESGLRDIKQTNNSLLYAGGLACLTAPTMEAFVNSANNTDTGNGAFVRTLIEHAIISDCPGILALEHSDLTRTPYVDHLSPSMRAKFYDMVERSNALIKPDGTHVELKDYIAMADPQPSDRGYGCCRGANLTAYDHVVIVPAFKYAGKFSKRLIPDTKKINRLYSSLGISHRGVNFNNSPIGGPDTRAQIFWMKPNADGDVTLHTSVGPLRTKDAPYTDGGCATVHCNSGPSASGGAVFAADCIKPGAGCRWIQWGTWNGFQVPIDSKGARMPKKNMCTPIRWSKYYATHGFDAIGGCITLTTTNWPILELLANKSATLGESVKKSAKSCVLAPIPSTGDLLTTGEAENGSSGKQSGAKHAGSKMVDDYPEDNEQGGVDDDEADAANVTFGGKADHRASTADAKAMGDDEDQKAKWAVNYAAEHQMSEQGTLGSSKSGPQSKAEAKFRAQLERTRAKPSGARWRTQESDDEDSSGECMKLLQGLVEAVAKLTQRVDEATSQDERLALEDLEFVAKANAEAQATLGESASALPPTNPGEGTEKDFQEAAALQSTEPANATEVEPPKKKAPPAKIYATTAEANRAKRLRQKERKAAQKAAEQPGVAATPTQGESATKAPGGKPKPTKSDKANLKAFNRLVKTGKIPPDTDMEAAFAVLWDKNASTASKTSEKPASPDSQ